jgi:hypothetical protein
VAHQRRHRLRRVRADEDDQVRGAEVGDRKRQAPVQAERPVPGSGRGRHAEPAVVVDLACLQRDTGELAEQVGLLVGQGAAAEHRDGVPAVPFLDLADPGGHVADGFLP